MNDVTLIALVSILLFALIALSAINRESGEKKKKAGGNTTYQIGVMVIWELIKRFFKP